LLSLYRSLKMRRLACLLFLAFALAAPGMAQIPEPEPQSHPSIPDAKQLAANYQLQSALGDRKCDIALEAKASGAGYALVYDRAVCVPLFAFLSDTAAWLPGVAGSIRFVSAGKRTVSEFTEGVDGQYEALLEGDGVYFLTNKQFAQPSNVPAFSDAVGEWNLSLPDSPAICGLSLSEQPAGDDMFKVTVKPSCDPAIVRFGPVKWYLDRGDIILLSAKDDRMRFERQPEGTWTKVPELPRALVLSRP
jgi:hypothetical protein